MVKAGNERRELRRAVLIQKTRGAAILAFEIAGKMRQLLVAKFHRDELDRFSCSQALIRDIKSIISQPLAERAAVGLTEVALNGAGGHAAEESDFARLELRAMGERLPIDVLIGTARDGEVEYGQMIGLNHAFGFNGEHFHFFNE